MKYAPDYSGFDYLVDFLVISFVAGAPIAWAFAVWWGTGWLLHNRKQRIVTVVMCVFPVLIAAMQIFGLQAIGPNILSAWLQATWMLTIARVVAPLLTKLASETDAIQGNGS